MWIRRARRIVMYFHGLEGVGHQVTRVATSANGIDFEARPEVLGRSYFRVFHHDGDDLCAGHAGPTVSIPRWISGFVERTGVVQSQHAACGGVEARQRIVGVLDPGRRCAGADTVEPDRSGRRLGWMEGWRADRSAATGTKLGRRRRAVDAVGAQHGLRSWSINCATRRFSRKTAASFLLYAVARRKRHRDRRDRLRIDSEVLCGDKVKDGGNMVPTGRTSMGDGLRHRNKPSGRSATNHAGLPQRLDLRFVEPRLSQNLRPVLAKPRRHRHRHLLRPTHARTDCPRSASRSPPTAAASRSPAPAGPRRSPPPSRPRRTSGPPRPVIRRHSASGRRANTHPESPSAPAH